MRLRSVVSMVMLVAVVLAGTGCSPGGEPTGSGPDASPTETTGAGSTGSAIGRDASWRADLDLIVPGMAAIHPHLFRRVSRAALEGAVDELSDRVPESTDDELMVGVLRVVALVSGSGCEGHTGAFVWGTGSYPVDSMPLRLWLFDDELVVVDALAPYRSLVGSRIDAIDGHPTADVLSAISPLVPHDNSQTIRLVSPRLVLIPQILRGLGLAGDGSITLDTSPATTPSGRTAAAESTVVIDPIPMADYNAWAGAYGLHLPSDPRVLYLSRIDDALWWKMLPDSRTLFVQYNRVDPLPPTRLDALSAALGNPRVAQVVLDVRHNYGGEVSALSPIVSTFAKPAAIRPGGFFVLTGRNTFSAGSMLVARLQDQTDAVVVGEPTGGCPTTWGDSSELTLPSSGLVVSVASELAVGVRRRDPRLTIKPDIPAVLGVREWLAGVDPALDATGAVAP
jgi:hypothetical protein